MRQRIGAAAQMEAAKGGQAGASETGTDRDWLGQLLALSDGMEEHTIEIRRKIHQKPELAFEEFETSRLVEQELRRLGIPYEKSPVEPGLVAEIDSGKPGRLLMMRAEMDALPIEEAEGLFFRSQKPGLMHACGHDIHVANLLAVGGLLTRMKDCWEGRVKLVFQPAEERGGGGREMIRNGLMRERPDACLGLHVTTDPGGQFFIGTGPLTSFSDRCEIVVHGTAGHSSEPQDSVDAVYIASSIVVALNTVVAKHLSPMEHSTLNVGRICGGSALNVITDRVEIGAMMRNADSVSRARMMEKIRSLSEGIASAMGGSCEVSFDEGYASVYNDRAMAEFVIETVETYGNLLWRGIVPPASGAAMPPVVKGDLLRLASDDFGFYSQQVPSCYIMMGVGEGEPVHTPGFRPDERYIKLASRVMASAAIRFLQSGRADVRADGKMQNVRRT